jgi:hypothetical protein
MNLSESYRRRIQELAGVISESRKTEELGLAILSKSNIQNPENIIVSLKAIDKSLNQKNIPNMAYFIANGYNDLKNIESVFADYDNMEKLKRIKPINYTKNGLMMGDKVFSDFIKFSEYIHGEKNKFSQKPEGGSNVEADFKADKQTLWSGNGIDIYDGNGVGKCISYTQGGLTGKGYGFCIGQPGNTMYKSYRDSKDSSFYFIIDRNHFKENADGSVNLDDPLHIVVLDQTKYGIELTDSNNTTGSIAEYGENVDKYISYLKSKGVPIEKLVNIPKTPQEEKEEELLGKKNDSLEWFMKLPIEYKSAYIGRGHLLTDEQFDYLIGNGQ